MQAVLVFTAAVVALSDAQACIRELEEKDSQGLERMWPMQKKLDCTREGIDAATTLSDGLTYFFKDDVYWRLNENDVDPGYPRLISQDWDGLPRKLDAAFTWTDNRTFFFKGDEYWSFHGLQMDPDYPKKISEGFPGVPNDLDAAAVWKSNKNVYLFKGSQYWRFEGGDTCKPVADIFPRLISVYWKNVPDNVDAVVLWKNGITYFIKGEHFYKYNDKDDKSGDPIPIDGKWGLKCSGIKGLIKS